METTLIKSGPGTGKTTRIVEEVVELLDRGIEAKNILCITYTNAAVENIKRRLKEGLQQKGYDEDKVLLSPTEAGLMAKVALTRNIVCIDAEKYGEKI